MTKSISFFGDSFVGLYEGWIKHFCVNYDYKCINVGKPGADPVYAFQKWKEANDTIKGTVDVCIYAHTAADRLYHPEFGLTSGVAKEPPRLFKKLTDKDYQLLKAAHNYYRYLVFPEAEDLKATLYPMGIDRYIKENNKVFKKIIHIWSFAPYRRHDDHNNSATSIATVDWPFEMFSGMNIKLDLANMSLLEPGFVYQGWDHRALHFDSRSNDFICDIFDTAIKNYTPDGVMDFRPYINKHSTWDDYVSAFNTIKGKLNENSNNRK